MVIFREKKWTSDKAEADKDGGVFNWFISCPVVVQFAVPATRTT